MHHFEAASSAEFDRLAAEARETIGKLRSRVLRRANGALPYDYIVPNGVYEEQWDWDAFFVSEPSDLGFQFVGKLFNDWKPA